MEIGTALEELRRRVMAERVAAERLEEAESETRSPRTAKITPAGGSHGGGAIGIDHRLERLERMRESWEACRARADALRAPIRDALKQIDPMDALAIEYRYFEGMRWEDVARYMNYSSRHVFRIKDKVLEYLGGRFEIVEEEAGDRLKDHKGA